MPNPYTTYKAGTAGTEISSTYEGRHLSLPESYLNHPTHADGFVDGGDPVTFGTVNDRFGVGVAFSDAAAATDVIALDTEGIWALSVVAVDDAGNAAVNIGDVIFINGTTCVLSKIRNQATNIPFGYALDTVASGATTVIAVKVHWDPMHDLEVGMYNTLLTTEYGWSFRGILTDGESEGAAGYVQADLYGTCAGHTYGLGSWMNLQAAYVGGAGNIHVPFEGGIWKGDADATLRAVFAGQHHAILNGAPASLHAWRLNTTQTIDAVIAAANAGSVGYAASATTNSTKVGDLPLADIVGHGIRWVRLYDAAG
jgi:hypothetical protein